MKAAADVCRQSCKTLALVERKKAAAAAAEEEKKWRKRRAIYVDVLLKISAYQAEKKEKFHVPP